MTMPPGLSGIPYGVDAVDQFQVVTSGGQAELGRALGGYINVVTKSGTNTSHGDLYGYFRDDNFNAPNALLRTQGPVRSCRCHSSSIGASLGGPILQGPHLLLRERRAAAAGSDRPDDDPAGHASVPSTRGWPRSAMPGGRWRPASIRIPVISTNVLGKIDHQFNGRDQFSVRYSLYDITSSNARGAGGLNAPSASAGLDNLDQSIAISNTLTLSPRTVNETRAQFAYSDLKALSTDPIGPTVSIAGVATFGTLSSSPQRRLNRMFQVVDNLSHQRGAHALRAGVDFLFNDDTHQLSRARTAAPTRFRRWPTS